MAIIDITKNLHDDQTLGVAISDKPLKLLNQAALLSPAIAGTFEFKDDVLYFTKSTGLARVPVSLGGTSGSGTTNELAYWYSASVLGTLPVATYPSLTEISYVKGVTSAIQAQINGKQATLTNPITGTGTANYLSKFTGASTLGNSLVYDNGTNVGIGTTSPTSALQVVGLPSYADNTAAITGGLTVGAFYHTLGTLKVVI